MHGGRAGARAMRRAGRCVVLSLGRLPPTLLAGLACMHPPKAETTDFFRCMQRRPSSSHHQPTIPCTPNPFIHEQQVTARLAARPGGPGGSALLAPESPGDIVVIEIGGSQMVAQQQQPQQQQQQPGGGPQQQQQGPGPGAVVVVRGAAAVLARYVFEVAGNLFLIHHACHVT